MLKRFFTLLLISSFIGANAQSPIDVLHYRFHIEITDNNDSIYGAAIIKFVVREKRPAIELDLTGIKKDGKGMLVTVVGYKTGLNSVTFKQEKDKLIIPSNWNKGDTAEVIINYKGIPADGLIISKNKYGHRTFFSDNWPDRAHNWIPCVDNPADKATVEFLVIAPSHYQVISNGLQIEESTLPDNKRETHWKENIPLPTKVMVIGAADFAVNYVGNVNCVPVYSWVFPENRKEGFYDYATAKDILAFYDNYIGTYPYEKLANVQSKTIFGGMENASAIFYFENSVTGERREESLIAHEIVHQWFGDMATEKSFAHVWLSEGFATYLTHVFIESKYGTDSLNKRMKNEREEVIDFVKSTVKPVVDSISPYMQLLNANSYQKGGWVLHMLRRELGDSIFKKCIRQYYAAYAGSNAETADFRKVVEKISGKDLSTFFKQWLFTPENPSLDISWKYDVKKKEVLINIVQQQKTEFRFPIEFAFINSKGKKTIEKFVVDKKVKSFTIALTEKPVTVMADPNVSLLFEGFVKEIK